MFGESSEGLLSINAVSKCLIAFTEEPVVQAGLHAVFEDDTEFDMECICHTHAELISAAAKHQPHLILYHFRLDADLDVIQSVRRIAPQSVIVLWSRDFSTELAHQMLEIGVRGLLSTTATPETIKKCLRTSAAGELWVERSLTTTLLNTRTISLSRRQTQLLRLLVQGLKNKEIAASLGISEGTVKAYLTTLFEKVGAKDRFELALFGLKNLRSIREAGTGLDLPTPVPAKSLVSRRNAQRPVA